MPRIVLIAPTDPSWAQIVQTAKNLDSRNRELAARVGMPTEGDRTLCEIQREMQGSGYMMVEISTNVFGYCVRDTLNDGAGVLFGGRSRPGTTKAEALAWAKQWHAERPTHREVIQGWEGNLNHVGGMDHKELQAFSEK